MSLSFVNKDFSSLLVPAPMQGLGGVRTFVTTRHGGCGWGTYSSFNCSPYSGDDISCVVENTKRLHTLLGDYPFPLIFPLQIHGTAVHRIDTAFLALEPDVQRMALEGVDALITDSPFCALCVSTADCVPVFFYDPFHKAIGVAHSGWRGTVNHIVLHTLRALEKAYATRPQDIYVAFGPCISLPAFEVGEEVYEAFSSGGFPMERVARRHPVTENWHISLQKAIYSELLVAGIEKTHIEFSSHCTYTEHVDFFSARRLGIHSGRILSGLFLT